jgi:hypothetical protein
MVLGSRTEKCLLMSSAVAPCLAGVLVALVAVWVVAATPRRLLLAARLAMAASVHQLALEALALVVEASQAASADVVEVAVASEVIVDLAAAEAEVLEAAVVEVEASVLLVAVSDTSPTATVLPTVLLPVLVVLVKEASVADAVVVEVATAVIADLVVAMAMTDAAEEVVTIADPAAPTTSHWAAETDLAMAVETVGMAATVTTTRASVATRATATTIHVNAGGIELSFSGWLEYAAARVCQGYLPFFRLIISRQ